MLNDDPFADLVPGASPPAPARTGYIPGVPKAKDPLETEYKTGQINAQRRDEVRAPLEDEAKRTTIRDSTINNETSMRKEFKALPVVKAFEEVLPKFVAATRAADNAVGDMQIITAWVKAYDPQGAIMSQDVQTAQEAQSAVEKLGGQWASMVDGRGRLLPEVRQNFLKEIHTRMGPMADAYRGERSNYIEIAKRTPGVNPDNIVGSRPFQEQFQDEEAAYLGRPVRNLDGSEGAGPSAAPKPSFGDIKFGPDDSPKSPWSPEQQAAYDNWWKAHPKPSAAQFQMFARSMGIENGQQIYDAWKKNGRRQPARTAIDADVRDRIAEKMAQNGHEGAAGVIGATDTATLGTGDEIVAGGDAFIQSLQGEGSIGELYDRNINVERGYRQELSRENPKSYLTGQLIGSLAMPSGIGRAGLNAARPVLRGGGTRAEAIQAAQRGTAIRAGGEGATIGGAYGFGSDEGNPLERLDGAAIGAVAGGGAGYGLTRGFQAAGPTIGNWMGRNATPEQQALLAAGERQGVRVDASDIRPGLSGTVGFLESMPGSSGRMQGAVAGGRDDIEAAVGRLADPNRAVSEQTAGAGIRAAGERTIRETGAARDRAYAHAERLDGGRTSVPAEGALREFDALLDNLGTMGGTNRASINALRPLRDDLVETVDGPNGPVEQIRSITIDGLRQFRRGMRNALTNSGVVAGVDDAQLQPIIQAATDDLFRAIERNSGPAAAAAFRRADEINTARMRLIDDTLKPFLGTLKKPTSSQQAFAAFEALASNKGKADARTLLNLQRSLTPDERIMVNATIMAKAGRRSADEPFSPAQFVSSMRDLSPGARRVMFGHAGARSIDDLIRLSDAKKGTVAMFNNSRSGKVSNFKDIISTVIFGAGGAAIPAIGSLGAAAVAGAGATMIGSNVMARVITNPNFVRLLANAPRTTNPRAIDTYMGRLRQVAARDPNLRGVVEGLEQRMIAAANDNAGQSGQLAASPDERPE